MPPQASGTLLFVCSIVIDSMVIKTIDKSMIW
jgi:hypothetical protein